MTSSYLSPHSRRAEAAGLRLQVAAANNGMVGGREFMIWHLGLGVNDDLNLLLAAQGVQQSTLI